MSFDSRKAQLRSLWTQGIALSVVLLGGCASMNSQSPSASGPLVDTSRSDTASIDRHDAKRQVLVTVKMKGSWRVPGAGSSGGGYDASYRASARTERLVSDLARSHDLREVSSWPIRPLGVHCIVFEIPTESDSQQVVDRLAGDDRVESVQPMNLFEVKANSYNDPYLKLQHGMSSMQVEEAHRWSRGVGVRIAVVDTGVDVAHPELRAHIRLARDFVDDHQESVRADLHGTAVTGVIVSTVDNGIGIIGVAPAAQILALRACWEADAGSAGRCSSFTLAKALTFAIERKPHIVNLSLAGPADPLLERLMQAALDRGIVVVAAVGDLPSQQFPSNLAGVLSVRSAKQTDDHSVAEEDRGAVHKRSLVAPGTDILTTSPAGGFDFLSGHSLATAHVSGVAALLLERQPNLSGQELFALLRDTSVPPHDLASRGPAMINACAALAKVVAGPDCGTAR